MFARRLGVVSLAYGAGVVAAALLATAGFGMAFGVSGWNFVGFTSAGIFVLSLPLTLLAIAFRGTAASSPVGAVLIGSINGFVSSVPFAAVAGPLALAVMLPAGGFGGAIFWLSRRRLSRGEARRAAR